MTCDGCGPNVSATVTVELPSGKTLDFCGHCANKHHAALVALLPEREPVSK
jgi:hypothetical protein